MKCSSTSPLPIHIRLSSSTCHQCKQAMMIVSRALGSGHFVCDFREACLPRHDHCSRHSNSCPRSRLRSRYLRCRTCRRCRRGRQRRATRERGIQASCLGCYRWIGSRDVVVTVCGECVWGLYNQRIKTEGSSDGNIYFALPRGLRFSSTSAVDPSAWRQKRIEPVRWAKDICGCGLGATDFCKVFQVCMQDREF